MTDPIEIMARALWNGREAEFPKLARMEWDKGTDLARAATIRHAKAFVTALADAGFAVVPVTPTEAQWGGLARAIIMWLDFDRKTPAALFQHLERGYGSVPQWLRDEHELKRPDHVPSKGTRAAIIYRAMIEAGSVKA